jgi:hypothetical protein
MALLSQSVRYAALALTAAYALLIAWKLYTRDIPLDGLLKSVDNSGKVRSSPGRLQLLLFTLVVAGQYLASVWKNPGAASLPPVPPTILAVVAGSHAVYLGGKALSTYLPLLKKLK